MAYSEAPAQLDSYELQPYGRHVRIAHGVVMAVVFLCLKPAGAILLHVFPAPLGLRAHVACQSVAWLMAFGGVGMGVWLASKMHRFGKQHPIIGFVVVAGMLLQPTIGYYHHLLFVRKHQGTWWGTAHVWLGRVIILLAIINGGIGLGDADNTQWGMIVYSVVAAVSFLAYIVLLIFLQMHERGQQTDSTRKESTTGAGNLSD